MIVPVDFLAIRYLVPEHFSHENNISVFVETLFYLVSESLFSFIYVVKMRFDETTFGGKEPFTHCVEVKGWMATNWVT